MINIVCIRNNFPNCADLCNISNSMMIYQTNMDEYGIYGYGFRNEYGSFDSVISRLSRIFPF